MINDQASRIITPAFLLFVVLSFVYVVVLHVVKLSNVSLPFCNVSSSTFLDSFPMKVFPAILVVLGVPPANFTPTFQTFPFLNGYDPADV